MHTDIKPCNLVIVSFNSPRDGVIDFRSARRTTRSNCVKTGTRSYWSSDFGRLWRSGQASGVEYDGKADIFAFGVSAYQIFCKEPKWWGQEVHKNALVKMKRGYEH